MYEAPIRFGPRPAASPRTTMKVAPSSANRREPAAEPARPIFRTASDGFHVIHGLDSTPFWNFAASRVRGPSWVPFGKLENLQIPPLWLTTHACGAGGAELPCAQR